MTNLLKLIALNEDPARTGGQIDAQNKAEPGALPAAPPGVLRLSNDADPRTLALGGVGRIDLHFPKFTDGRAYSQAFLLRRRLGFAGEIRATGDVLIDQLQQMQRSGFDVAELRADQDAALAQAQLARFGQFYQGDAVQPQPLFAKAIASASNAPVVGRGGPRHPEQPSG